jgi:uncharacterized protein YyaL (SSP411 family)
MNRDFSPNRLAHETSPYLLQHARNPVDWYPWGEEAFAKAKKEDKPIFLSVGYSTCHWCHVMAHESFENHQTAELLNAKFVCIKVDREERPDIDEIYLRATQLWTGRGGWPNSVWLTPARLPWYAGTYFPRESFISVCRQLAEAWDTRRPEVLKQAQEFTRALQQNSQAAPPEAVGQLDTSLLEAALKNLQDTFDAANGGFGPPPKFPPHGALRLLLHAWEHHPKLELQQMLRQTLEAMASGGIHDQIGGGFHRYSTDAHWLVPHFEKMLYDNAQLLGAYAEAYRLTQNPEYRRTVKRLVDWLQREMTSPEGGFYSALDADSEGEEGKYYLWTWEQLQAALPPEEVSLFGRAYGMLPQGNYRDEISGRQTGANIPHLPTSLSELAATEDADGANLQQRLEHSLETLLNQRQNRIRPHLDDKIITAWNGLMIGALARTSTALEEPAYRELARQAADFVLTHLYRDGILLRTYRANSARQPGYLDDYAFLAQGLLELHETCGNRHYLETARQLADHLIKHFHSKPQGGFTFTSDSHEGLLGRSRLPYDSALPSGNAIAASVLLRLEPHFPGQGYRPKALATLRSFLGFMEKAPSATQTMILAAVQAGESNPSDASESPPALRVPPVSVRIAPPAAPVSARDAFRLEVILQIDPGWHLNTGTPGNDTLFPTSVDLAPSAHFTLTSRHYPPGKKKTAPFSKSPLDVYEDSIRIALDLVAGPELPKGPKNLKLQLSWQACDASRCLPHVIRTLNVEF